MVKFGKLYRELQIPEFKEYYINYKKLKQKIKQIQSKLPQISQNITIRFSNSSNLKLRPTISSSFDVDEPSMEERDEYSLLINDFKNLLNSEFEKCYKFFKTVKKSIHNKLNRHLYTQTNYTSYKLKEFLDEINNLRSTMYSAKCLNDFINDNMTAIKKILKKFDKKFSNYFGIFGPNYIIENLSKQNSDMEYLLQFKVIDETSIIIESNLKLLDECFKDYCNNNRVSHEKKNEFEIKKNSIREYIKDIDEVIYFRIQYKEWFYFIKKDAQIISSSKLFKNLMFNPILFSAYYKDDLMHKFLSRNDAINEIEKRQISMSKSNKMNIALIFIQTFFYNTLISGIYPFIFELMGETKDKSFIPYSLLIIASTYLFSYFSIILQHYIGSRNIKCQYTFSYILFIVGSLSYIFSYQINEKKEFNKTLFQSVMVGFLVVSRVLIGLGANLTLGRNYILNHCSKFYLPLISKIYVFISILGHSFGPLIGFFLYGIYDTDIKIFKFLYYSKFNCIGWYGLIMSLILLLLHLIFFTPPYSKNFKELVTQSAHEAFSISYSYATPSPLSQQQFIDNDMEDEQDKEFYRLQKEKDKFYEESEDSERIENDNNEINDIDENNSDYNAKMKNINKDYDENIMGSEENDDYNTPNKEIIDKINKKPKTEIKLKKASTLCESNKRIDIKKENEYKINPLLIIREDEEKIKEEIQEEGSFTNVNMIPRAIEDIIRKEKSGFMYLNKNLLIILITLFFNNLLKENFVGYCSYYFYYLIEFDNNNYIEVKYLPFFISVSYLLEMLSMPFILPLYRFNKSLSKSLLILMIVSIILMIPISISVLNRNIYFYFSCIALVFLMSSIIEVLSSCYLAYLTPPEWKFSQMDAGKFPFIIMTFGKLSGCLICLAAFSENLMLNHYIVLGLSFIGYGISMIFILKSKNFRVKAIARIMRKKELEQNIV